SSTNQILVGTTTLDRALDQDCGEIVLLPSSLGKLQHCVVKLSNDHLRFAIAELPYYCGEPFGAELFPRAVLRFKKAVGDQEHDVIRLQLEISLPESKLRFTAR